MQLRGARAPHERPRRPLGTTISDSATLISSNKFQRPRSFVGIPRMILYGFVPLVWLQVELFDHPHVLLLQVRNSSFLLPGGRLRPGEEGRLHADFVCTCDLQFARIRPLYPETSCAYASCCLVVFKFPAHMHRRLRVLFVC